MFMLLVAILVLVILIMQDILCKRSVHWRHLWEFPGDHPLPLIGNALTVGFDSDGATQRLLEMWERHRKTSFRVSVGSENWVLLSDSDHVAALFADSSILSKPPKRNAAVKLVFGESVSTSEGDRWRWARKLVLASFHVKSIGQRLDEMNAHSERLIQVLSKYENKEDVPLYQYLRPFMLDVLFMINMITENYFSYWRNIRPIFILTPMYKEMVATIKVIQNTASSVITERKKKIKQITEDVKNNNKYATVDLEKVIQDRIADDNTLIDAFFIKKLPNGDTVPEDVINEEISFIYFTGHFTTAVTVSHVLYCLAKHPEIQDRVLEEQKSIFHDDILRKSTMKDLNEIKYLEAVIKETLRMIPTVPKIGRKLKNDLLLKDGRVIPAGTTAIVYYEAMFFNEKYFLEPKTFNPDRFLQNNIHPHAFLPFGGGPRSCLGFRFAWMALKATLSNILRRFEVAEGATGTEPQFAYRIVTESKNGISIKLKKRYLL